MSFLGLFFGGIFGVVFLEAFPGGHLLVLFLGGILLGAESGHRLGAFGDFFGGIFCGALLRGGLGLFFWGLFCGVRIWAFIRGVFGEHFWWKL